MMKRVIIGFLSVMWLVAMDISFAEQKLPASSVGNPSVRSAKPSSAVVQSPRKFPVRFADTDILFISTSPISWLTPEKRAKLIQQNIQTFADSKADINLLKLIKQPQGIGIGSDYAILMVITDQDAENTGKTPEELAKAILVHLQELLGAYRGIHVTETYIIGAASTVLAIFGLWLALFLNNKTYWWLKNKSTVIHDHLKGGLHFKKIEVISSRQIENIVMLMLKTLRILIVLLCLDIFLPLILSFFPETRPLSSKIFGYVIAPFVKIFHGIITYIPDLFFIFVIGVVTFYALKVIAYVFRLVERGELKFDWFYTDWARPTYQIVRFFVIVTALISAYPYIPGSNSQAFQGVGLVLGAIISFASSSAISNIVAGVILTYTRAFRLGDRIKVGETTGDVVDKTLLVTRVETVKSEVVTIPNSLVMNAQIINFSISADGGDGVILHTSVTIGYDVPWKQVRDLLVEAAKETKNIMDKPDPFVLQTALGDFYVTYEINAYTKEPKYMAFAYSELHKNILDKFDAAGVEIMSPHYFALRDGNAAAVPSVLAGKGYKPPPFQVNVGPVAE
jgi:small-conductance mechanosensitive channel